MKPLKTVLTILMCIVLLAAEGILMGLFSADRALSEKTIKSSLVESDVIGSLVDEAIAENTVNMGGIYGEFAKEVFHTEVMEDFFVDYLTAAVDTEIYGRPHEEVAYDELTSALTQGVDEVISSGRYDISPLEADIIVQAVKEEAPALTAAIDSQVNRYEAVSGSMTENAVQPTELVKRMMSSGFRIFMALVCLALCAGIIFMCRRSRLGLLWCAIVTFAAAAAYAALPLVMRGAGWMVESAVSPSEKMILTMMTEGFTGVAVAGAAAGGIFLILFIIMRVSYRKKAERKI